MLFQIINATVPNMSIKLLIPSEVHIFTPDNQVRKYVSQHVIYRWTNIKHLLLHSLVSRISSV